MDNTYTVDLESMGRRIRELRNTQNKTQEVFADMIHISASYLALIEQGKRTASLDVVAQIAHCCYVSVDYLLFGKQESQPSENQKTFDTLCRRYSAQEIRYALKFCAFYLELEDMKKSQ